MTRMGAAWERKEDEKGEEKEKEKEKVGIAEERKEGGNAEESQPSPAIKVELRRMEILHATGLLLPFLDHDRCKFRPPTLDGDGGER